MIYALTPVKAAQAVLSRMAAIEINAILQTGIEVLDKEAQGRFLIRMGQHTFTTKSETPLLPGRAYWVDMAQTKEGIIQLHHPHPKPLLLQKSFQNLFDEGLLKTFAKKEHPSASLKEHLLHALSAATSKEQFQNLTQLLLSLHHGVVTIPVEKEGRRALLQMRRRKREGDLNQKSVEFYAAMNNIGPVEGRISQGGGKRHLTLSLFYPKSVALLERHAKELEGFDRVEIGLNKSDIAPFWDASSTTLLDIKG
ncbi:hypothetical protein [Hydrogenimonas sp. SS33]|uniref:hypothetical protein n=1 Tax=Hydrogenimonas leucolamina TaxID=2954236 RepID=UPI00336C07FB